MSEITVGELLMQCLHAEGVDMMAGIIDGAHIPFVVHAERYGVRYVNGHHEEAVVHVAEGYTRIRTSRLWSSPTQAPAAPTCWRA